MACSGKWSWLMALAVIITARPAVAFAQVEEPEEGDEDREPGFPVPPPGDIAEIDIQQLLIVPIVEAASKRLQSIYEAPAAISSFQRTQVLSANPVIPIEVLRRVPGAHVMQLNAQTYNLGLRGWNSIVNTRIPMLIDGRRVAEGSLSYIPWGAFPVPLGEVERMEVVRGPGATLYGADAFSGVLTITTISPLAEGGVDGQVVSGVSMLPDTTGDGRKERMSSLTSGDVAAAWRNASATAGVRGSVSFDYMPEFQDLPSGGTTDPYFRYGPVGLGANLSAAVKPASRSRFTLNGSYVFTEINETVTAAASRATLATYSDIGGLARFESDDIGGSGLSVLAQADVTRALKASATRNATTMSFNGAGERRFTYGHALLQADWRAWHDRSVLTLGLEGSIRDGFLELSDNSTSKPSAVFAALFIQDELKLARSPDVILNLGVRFERIESSDEEKPDITVTYRNASPRASLIFKPARSHSLRLSAATGFRQPSLFENFLNQGLPGFNPPFLVSVSNPSLKPEEVRSIEVGYRGKPASWLRVDLVGWAQQLRDMIGIRTTRTPFQTENSIDVDQAGVELGLQARLRSRASAYASYGLTQHLTNENERTVPRHIVSVGGDLELGAGTHVGADLYVAPAYMTTFMSTVSQIPTLLRQEVHAQYVVNLRAGRRLGKNVEVFAYAMNLASLFRDVDELHQYPAATVHPIGASAFLGVRVEGL